MDSGLGFEPFREPPLTLQLPDSFRREVEVQFGHIRRWEDVFTVLKWAVERSGDNALLVGDYSDRWVIPFIFADSD